MISPRLSILVAALVVAVGFLVLETHLVTIQRRELAQLTQDIAVQSRDLAALRERRDGTARDIALAEQQLSRLPIVAITPSDPPSGERPLALHAWLERMRRLRALVAETPAVAIPEMQLLNDEDWMRAAQHAAFETDAQRRESLAALRSRAKEKFVMRLASAARKWTEVEGADQQPRHTSELARHFDEPVDPAVLNRYEIVKSRSTPPWQIRERAPIDEDYDARHTAGGNGSYGSSGGPLTWHEDYEARVQLAYRTHAAAHPEIKRPSVSHIIPYIHPPLPPAAIEKLLRAERERTP